MRIKNISEEVIVVTKLPKASAAYSDTLRVLVKGIGSCSLTFTTYVCQKNADGTYKWHQIKAS